MGYPTLDIAATGQRIAELMRIREFCAKDIQEYLGLSAPQAVYKWLWGVSLPSIDNLFALSKLFEIPIDTMLVGKLQEDRRCHIPVKQISNCITDIPVSYHVVSETAS